MQQRRSEHQNTAKWLHRKFEFMEKQNIRCQSQYLRRDTGLGNTGEIRALINNSDLLRAAIRHDSLVGVG